MAFSGIKLKFNENNEFVKFTGGAEILPHRTDVIEEKLKNRDLAGLETMFFNLTLKDCRCASTRDHIKKENKLLEKYFKLIKQENFSPDAA